jgi:sugar O-acyltransferase (sialic acid O-acetyltransferase NeuD family)
MSMEEVIILGVNGNCIDIAEAVEISARPDQPQKVLGFLDDNRSLHGAFVAGYPVLGGLSEAARFANAVFVNGIGSPRSFRSRSEIIARTEVSSARWATVVHPRASVSPRATIGRGCVLLAGASVGARAVLGNHVTVLQNSIISHDSAIHDFTAIATGVCVSGNCVVGRNCYLGCNCSVRDGVHVGDFAMVGMGAAVVANVAAGAVVMGVPARGHQ